MARPCKHDTTHFLRPLTPEQRAILLHAGEGDLTRGWNEVLDLYASIHQLRPFVRNENSSQLGSETVKVVAKRSA